MAFTVTVKATCITVQPGEEAVPLLNPLIELFTYEDEFAEETNILGFMHDPETDTLYFHRGVDLNYLRKLLINVKMVEEPPAPCEEMKFEYEEIIAPRNAEQEDVIDFLACEGRYVNNVDRSQLFLVLGTGKGKMEPCSRKIPAPVPKGYIKMGDIKVGDYVFDRHGIPTEVTAVYDHGMQPIYKITFNDGRNAYCGSDHLWGVLDENHVYSVKSTKELMEDYCAHDEDGKPHYHYRIPKCEPVLYPTQNVPMDPWVVGCFISKGVVVDSTRLCIKSSTDEIPKEIARRCDCDTTLLRDDLYYFFKETRFDVLSPSEFFRKLPRMISGRSIVRKIPDVYLYNNIETRTAVLCGITNDFKDIDVLRDDSFRYALITYQDGRLDFMVSQIKTILFSMGYECYISIRRSSHTSENDAYHKTTLVIKNIEYSHKERARCITCDNDEHLYLTEDFIVTHNTFCSCTALCKSKMKTLIITHRDSIRNQWGNTLLKMIGMSSKDIHIFDEASELAEVAFGNYLPEADVYLVTHQTFKAAVKRVGDLKKIGAIPRKLHIGLKIIDEAHLEFRSTLFIDFILNIKRNIYMTATFGRSDKNENAIFRHVFANAKQYIPLEYNSATATQPKKWVEYNVVSLNTHVPMNLYRYRIAGGRGMNSGIYGRFVIKRDKQLHHFKCCLELLHIIYERDDKSKVLIFMPLIDLCTEAAYFFTSNLDYDEDFPFSLSIKTINSTNTKSENEYNKRADVIVTTIGSCGTGTDIPGITDIICCSPFASSLTAKQVFGRLRYCGKQCHYYDIYDVSVPMDLYWIKARAKVLKKLATNTNTISWVPEDERRKE